MEFIKHDARKLRRVGSSWRLPRGKKNRDKRQHKGHRKLPQEGFMRPKDKRYKIAGKVPILVQSINDISQLDQNNIVILSSSLSKKKKDVIFRKCQERNIRVLNYDIAKDAEKIGK